MDCYSMKKVKIIVNTRELIVEKKYQTLSYYEIVDLAGFKRAAMKKGIGEVLYTITYSRGILEKPEGSLTRHDTVAMKNGMIINVSLTNNG